MNAQVQEAILGFSFDLTDPNASWLPVGAIVVGSTDGSAVTASVAIQFDEELCRLLEERCGFQLDPLTREILDDVPRLIERQLTAELGQAEGRASRKELEERGVLWLLHHALRNSLHVQTLSDKAELDVATPAELQKHVSDRAIELSVNEFSKFLRHSHQQTSDTETRATESVRTRASSFWADVPFLEAAG